MSWSSGRDIAEEVWEKICKYIPDNKKEIILANIVKVFIEYDCDDWDSDMLIPYLKHFEPDEYKNYLNNGES